MKKLVIATVIGMGIFVVPFTCVHAGWKPSYTEADTKQDISNSLVSEVVTNFKNHYPNINIYFDKAYGYAVFPTITKGGIGIGAAHGYGEVYQKSTLIGDASVIQVNIGLQLGGQQYSEIVFFKDKETLEDFKNGKVKLGARASAVAATAGVSEDADYNEGVAVFTLTKAGLMYEASVGGQKFKFVPK